MCVCVYLNLSNVLVLTPAIQAREMITVTTSLPSISLHFRNFHTAAEVVGGFLVFSGIVLAAWCQLSFDAAGSPTGVAKLDELVWMVFFASGILCQSAASEFRRTYFAKVPPSYVLSSNVLVNVMQLVLTAGWCTIALLLLGDPPHNLWSDLLDSSRCFAKDESSVVMTCTQEITCFRGIFDKACCDSCDGDNSPIAALPAFSILLGSSVLGVLSVVIMSQYTAIWSIGSRFWHVMTVLVIPVTCIIFSSVTVMGPNAYTISNIHIAAIVLVSVGALLQRFHFIFSRPPPPSRNSSATPPLVPVSVSNGPESSEVPFHHCQAVSGGISVANLQSCRTPFPERWWPGLFSSSQGSPSRSILEEPITPNRSVPVSSQDHDSRSRTEGSRVPVNLSSMQPILEQLSEEAWRAGEF